MPARNATNDSASKIMSNDALAAAPKKNFGQQMPPSYETLSMSRIFLHVQFVSLMVFACFWYPLETETALNVENPVRNAWCVFSVFPQLDWIYLDTMSKLQEATAAPTLWLNRWSYHKVATRMLQTTHMWPFGHLWTCRRNASAPSSFIMF